MENKNYKHYIESITNGDLISMHDAMIDLENQNRILLIEDNIGDARLVELLLRESYLNNCSIKHVTTLADGIEQLRQNDDFIAILLDLSLPDSRGFETLRSLLFNFPQKNVIVLTGFSDKNIGVQAIKEGAQDFLEKGNFDAETLSKTLRFSIERNATLKRLEETQRMAHIGNWEYSPNSKKFVASDEVYRIFGFKPHQDTFSYKDLQNFAHPFFVFNQIHKDTFEVQPKTLQRDLKIKRNNGELRSIYAQCSVIIKANGEISFNGVLQDITERKQAEEKVLMSQVRYENIFSKSKDAIFIADFDGRLSDFNKATLDLTAYSENELKRLKVYHIFGNEEFWNRVFDDLKNGVQVKDREIEFEDKNDKKTYCLLTASPQKFKDFEGFNGILRDVTEHKHAEELRKARDLAKQSAQLKEKFIASISHEMRTPMNAILGMSNLVLKSKGLSEEHFNYISSIKQSSEILLGIVNDILEVATLQNGKLKFENADFDLHELLANLVNVMTYKINEKDLSFELSIDENVPRIMKGDKIRLNQILYNLVGNAVKFTDKGFIKIFIEKINESSGSVHVKFTVEDSGIGIPKDKVGAIFDTFTRIRTKDRIFEGTGLGLSIAKNLVEYQGGKIWAESELGVGSKFYFDLILETADNSSQINDIQSDTPRESINPDLSFNLLLVEDHKMNQLVARKTLEKQWKNINITIADNGQIAVDLLKEKTFDIILMDIQMPVMDGYETTQYIRHQMPSEISSLPILAMTAHAHVSKDEKFKEYGMDDFVLKPFEPEQLFQKILKYLNKNK